MACAVISWNAANLPTQIAQGSDTLSFHYAPARQRYKQTATIGGQSIITHYVGGLMEAIGGNGVVQYRHRIVAAGEVVAQHTRDSDVAGGNPRTTYTQTDMLGSIGLITDESANVIGKMHFDPWGKRLNAETWNGNPTSGQLTALRNITHRGFTDHEMLDSMNLVHMNGRVYDPNLARMLSADPINSNPANLQRYNRYSYVNNNPLAFTDPSGFDGQAIEPMPIYWRCQTDSCWGSGSAQTEDPVKLPPKRVTGRRIVVTTISTTSGLAHFMNRLGDYQRRGVTRLRGRGFSDDAEIDVSEYGENEQVTQAINNHVLEETAKREVFLSGVKNWFQSMFNVHNSGMVTNPNGYHLTGNISDALHQFASMFGLNIVVTGGMRESGSTLGAGSNSQHVIGDAADIFAEGLTHLQTALLA